MKIVVLKKKRTRTSTTQSALDCKTLILSRRHSKSKNSLKIASRQSRRSPKKFLRKKYVALICKEILTYKFQQNISDNGVFPTSFIRQKKIQNISEFCRFVADINFADNFPTFFATFLQVVRRYSSGRLSHFEKWSKARARTLSTSVASAPKRPLRCVLNRALRPFRAKVRRVNSVNFLFFSPPVWGQFNSRA